MTHIKDNIDKVKAQIAACQQINAISNEVQLLAVSKTKPSATLEQAYQGGQRDFGENYLQEALEKIQELAHLPDICWHFIGPIQSNKTKQIAENFAWVQSVDRAKIATRLNDHRRNSGKDTPLNICLQVNISHEESKSGVLVNDLFSLAEIVANCDKLTLRGLMAIPEKNATLATYQHMQHLFNELKAQYPTVDTLSLGMSNDMSQAIAAGSTMVRIGTAIFGARNT